MVGDRTFEGFEDEFVDDAPAFELLPFALEELAEDEDGEGAQESIRRRRKWF